MTDVPEIDLTDPALLRDPFTAYTAAREQSPVARLKAPGFGPFWAVTRHEEARAMRFRDLALAGELQYTPDPGTWRLTSLPVTI